MSAPAPARLALADGTVFRGAACGARGVAVGEVCFNTHTRPSSASPGSSVVTYAVKRMEQEMAWE